MTHQDKNGAVLQPLSSNQLVWLALSWLADYIGFKFENVAPPVTEHDRDPDVKGPLEGLRHTFLQCQLQISAALGPGSHNTVQNRPPGKKKKKNGPLRFPDRWRILTRRHCQLKLVAVPFEQVRKPAV